MSDANTNNTNAPQYPRFPFITVGATLVALFAFLFLMWFATRKENPLEVPKPDAGEVKTVPDVDEIKKRNDAALNGVGAEMSREQARGKLLTTLKTKDDKLPFPIAPKGEEKKEKEK